MYQIREGFPNLNSKQVAVEIFKTVNDPEVAELVETKVLFVPVIVPDGWEILHAWKPEEEGEF
jgi:hypothetical protein